MEEKTKRKLRKSFEGLPKRRKKQEKERQEMIEGYGGRKWPKRKDVDRTRRKEEKEMTVDSKEGFRESPEKLLESKEAEKARRWKVKNANNEHFLEWMEREEEGKRGIEGKSESFGETFEEWLERKLEEKGGELAKRVASFPSRIRLGERIDNGIEKLLDNQNNVRAGTGEPPGMTESTTDYTSTATDTTESSTATDTTESSTSTDTTESSTATDTTESSNTTTTESTVTTTSTTTDTTEKPQDDDNLQAILLGIFIPLTVIAIAVVVFIIYKKKRGPIR